ncbi:hypothetical protein EPUL_003798 [Erysiphe pulchra]|uniref:Uncharacterized protein n=1 Tax=Erysiphe pulchra TaxID=225359 RepID=A0A2S4PX75_9PEZI|nr:hypothetical protein EPUL_003798 [Erysiphe pulchra]
MSNKEQVASVSQCMVTKEKSQTISMDKRLFVRIPKEHEWRKISPAGLCETKPVHSGFALSPCKNEAREAILTAANGLFMTGARLDQATNWIRVIIPIVTTSIRKEHREIEVSSSMLIEEVERVCSIRPTHVKLYGRNKAEAPHRTWMAFFSKLPRKGFRVFDESGIAQQFKKQKPLEFCIRFNGLILKRTAPGHRRMEIVALPTTPKNSAWLLPSTEIVEARIALTQIKTYRQAGEREYQAVILAKAAEESAAPVDKLNSDLASSQISEVDVDIDNIPASSVENSTGGALRL